MSDGDYIEGICVVCEEEKDVDPQDKTCIDCWSEKDEVERLRRKGVSKEKEEEPERMKGRCEGIEGVVLVAGCRRSCNLIPETHLCVPCHADHLKRKLLGDVGPEETGEGEPQPPGEDPGKKKEDAEMVKNEKKRKNKVAVCLKCGEEITIIGRGLCGKCYWQEHRAGTLDANYPKKKSWGRKKKAASASPPPAPPEEPAETAEAVLERAKKIHAPGARMSKAELEKSLQEKSGFDKVMEDGNVEEEVASMTKAIRRLADEVNKWKRIAAERQAKLELVRDMLTEQAEK